MELPLTSLVPSIVEIARFIESNWPHIWWFPNWYLGVPLRFVTGPVMPGLLIFLHKIVPGISLLNWYLLLIFISWIFGAVGVYFLTKELGSGKRAAQVSGLVFLLFPLSLFLFSFGSGLAHIATALVVWCLLFWQKIVSADLEDPSSRPSDLVGMTKKRIWIIFITFITAIILLINLASVLALIVGFTILVLLKERKERVGLLIKEILVLLTAIFLSSIWYSPKFWWVILNNPSFGGKPLNQVIVWLFNLLQAVVPIILGIWVVQKRFKFSSKILRFSVLFLSSFGFLTFIRFISDWDFWMDWLGYGLELQLGLSLLIPILFKNLAKSKYFVILVSILMLFGNFIIAYLIFIKPAYQVRAYKNTIKEIVAPVVAENKRVFLSGSPVFWLGSELPGLMQVRGNRDEGSTHKTWAMGAYQIREGENKAHLSYWVGILSIGSVLVNDNQSLEFFRDFKNLDRFDKALRLNKSIEGNKLYDGTFWLSRFSSNYILKGVPPKTGDDDMLLEHVIDSNVPYMRGIVTANFTNPQEIYINFNHPPVENAVISIAITYDRNWNVSDPEAQVLADKIGNMAIEGENLSGTVKLNYQESWLGSLFSAAGVLVLIILLLNSEKVVGRLVKYSPSMTNLEKDEEREY